VGVLVLVLALALPGAAWGASAKARLDQSVAHVGAAVTLTITVSGARSVGKTRMPELSSFDVVPGVTQMRSAWVQGRAVQQVVLTYYLYPREVGRFTIGGIGVDANGTTLWTSPLELEVVPARTHGSGPVDDHFLEVEVNPETPYAGQPIIYVVRFGFSTSIKNFDLEDPDWGGLLEEASLDPEMFDTYEVIDGRRFRILEWKIPLFSLRPGIYEVGPSTAQFDQVVGVTRRMNPLFNDPIFDQFFSTAQLQPVTLESDPLTVEVLALPEDGRPESFTGLIGSARLRGALSREQCSVGESVSLTLELRGAGNVQDVDLDLEIPEGIKPYGEDPTTSLQWSPDGPYGTVQRVFDLVPLVAGEAVIPAVEVGYFDPDGRRYRTAKAGPFRLSIDAGEGEEAHGAHSADLLVDEAAIAMLTAEPFPALERGGHRHLATPLRFGAVAAALLVPPGLFGALAALRRRQRRHADPERVRRQRALRRARARLDEVGGEGPVAAAAAIDGALRDFLADRAGVPVGASSPEELAAVVADAGAAEDTAADLVRWLTDLGAVRYAGRSEPSIGSLVDRARDLIDRLAEELP